MATTLAEDYLAGTGGDVYKYHRRLGEGQHLGTAFFAALNLKDRVRLAMNPKVNPRHYNDVDHIIWAIEFLLDTE